MEDEGYDAVLVTGAGDEEEAVAAMAVPLMG